MSEEKSSSQLSIGYCFTCFKNTTDNYGTFCVGCCVKEFDQDEEFFFERQ